MSIECSECERDLRGGHAEDCSRHPQNKAKQAEPDSKEASQNERVVLCDLLAEKHTGMKISATGVLGRIRDGRMYSELRFGCGEMLRHLEEMASCFYAGDVKAVDEFLQLYCLDGERPSI